MNQGQFEFIRAISNPQIRERIDTLKMQRPEILTLSYMLGEDRMLEWGHTIGVVDDDILRELAPPIAPPRLRQITASHSEVVFIWTGLYDLSSFVSHYRRHGKASGQVRALDFGCGGGRMTRFLSMHPDFIAHGSEINPDHVDWCRSNLLDVRTEQNGFSPPFRFDAGSLDFIYALSVFSHLSEQSMGHWLNELNRVAASGAILLLTTHGETALRTIAGAANYQEAFQMKQDEATALLAQLPQNPFAHVRYNDATAKLAKAGEGYGNCFISQTYIENRWPSFGFELLEYIPGGVRSFQDIVLLKKV